MGGTHDDDAERAVGACHSFHLGRLSGQSLLRCLLVALLRSVDAVTSVDRFEVGATILLQTAPVRSDSAISG